MSPLPFSFTEECETFWTEYLNVDEPGGDGDLETMEKLKLEEKMCLNPIAIEAIMCDER